MKKQKTPKSNEERAKIVMRYYNIFRLIVVLVFIGVTMYLMNK